MPVRCGPPRAPAFVTYNPKMILVPGIRVTGSAYSSVQPSIFLTSGLLLEMLMEQLPPEIQALVFQHLGPHDLHSLLIATGRKLHHLFACFSDNSGSSFFEQVDRIPLQDIYLHTTAKPAAINLIEITNWTSLDIKQLCRVFLDKHNVFVVTLDANPEDSENMAGYANLNYFLRSFLPKSHILLQGLVSGITLDEANIVVPAHLTIAHSHDVHIHAPDSGSATKGIVYNNIDNLTIESYSAAYLENFNFESSPTNSLHLDSIEPYKLSNVVIAAQSVAIEGISAIENATFTGTNVTLVAHPHLSTDPNCAQNPVPSLIGNVHAPNLETGAFFFDSVFPHITNIYAPKLKHASFYSRARDDLTVEDLQNLDSYIDSDFSYLQNIISIEMSIFDAPIIQCPQFPHLQSMSLELVRPLNTQHIFPSLTRLSVTLLTPYQGPIPELNAPMVQQFTLAVRHGTQGADLDNLTSALAKFKPLRRLSVDVNVSVGDKFKSKLNDYLQSPGSCELKSLKLYGLPPLEIFANKRAMMASLSELNIRGSFDKLSISFYAPELQSIIVKTVLSKLSRVKIRGFPKLQSLTVRSPVNNLSLTRIPLLQSLFVGGYLHTLKADYLPVVKELMYTMPPGATVQTVEMVDYINPKVHRAEALGDDDVWFY